MSIALQYYATVSYVDIDGVPIKLGSMAVPLKNYQASIDGLHEHKVVQVAAAGTATIWSAAISALDDFDFVWIRSDQDSVRLQLTCKDGDANEENFLVTLAAGVPFVLADDTSEYNLTPDFAAGTVDAIDKLMVENLASVAANIEVLVIT